MVMGCDDGTNRGQELADSNDTKICSNCVGEPFLHSLIEQNGTTDACSYCGAADDVCISLEELADFIEGAFERHYERTSDQPDMYESMLLRDRESDYDWDRHGEPVLYAISEAASIEEEVAQDVLDLLEERHADFEMAQMGEECDFSSESHYELKSIEDHEFAFEFNALERSLKSESRFFSQGAVAFLARLFSNIDGLQTDQGQPVTVTAGPEANITGIFRARLFHNGKELDAALARPDLHVGPPPSRMARAGRMNANGISVFYGATDPGVALAEVRPPVGSRAVVARFDLVRQVRLLDVEALHSVYVEGSIFDPKHLDQLALSKFLGRLSDRITMPVMPDDEPTEYLITQMISDYLAQRPLPGLDGILFPSVQCPGNHRNVVLFHHASRVIQLQFPEGTELSASQSHSTDEGPEPDYSVIEEVPAPDHEPAEVLAENNKFPNFTSMLNAHSRGFSFDDDYREETLRVIESMVSVHHVRSVTFDTDTFPVNRHRSVKREPPF
jgi:RES domain